MDTDLWYDYDWNWKTPQDVREFVDLLLENFENYEHALGSLEDLGFDNFYTLWWCSTQDAIARIAMTFNDVQLKESIRYLLAPEDEFVECDAAIFDALLKHVDGFPSKYPEFSEYLEIVLSKDKDYTSDWWDYSWYTFEGRDLTWTFWGPETLARSVNVDVAYLRRIFLNSFIDGTSYKTFRARVALAMNPNCPPDILEFLWENKDGSDWLVNDPEEEGLLLTNNGTFSLDEDNESLEARRTIANDVANSFYYETSEMWSTAPGAEFMENLFDILWEAEDARTCLLAAFAKNTSLEASKYEELLKASIPLVTYFLSKNPSIPTEMKAQFALENPTFTYDPYDNSTDGEEVTLV